MQLSRQEYFAKQRELSRAILRAEQEAARRIRAATRELVLPLVKQYAEQGMITYPTEELARQIDHIIREEAAKPVAAARKLQDDMEASLAEKLGVNLRPRPEPQENARQRRLENAKEPVGTIIKTPGRGWGYGTSGLVAYHRDPKTGKIVWDDLPLEYQFRKRADLSEQVWKAVEEQERMVFDVIRGGRAAGRNVKDICGDLEQFINYQDGGKRVVGRWGKMFPNTEEGRREAIKHEYLAERFPGLQYGTPEAREFLKQPDAKMFIQHRMATAFGGRTHIPDSVKQYAARLGKAGLDYRAIRIARDDVNTMVSDEQKEIARNSDISSGLVDWVMDRGRDSWSCRCEELAKGGPYDVDNMADKDGNSIDCPLHPNCSCQLVPRLRTDEEILAALREEMKDDLETIEGTKEQKELLEQIDAGVLPSPDTFGGGAGGAVLGQPDGSGGSNSDNDPAKLIERSPDYSKMSFVEAMNLENNYLQKRTAETGNEYMSIMTDDKKVLGTWEGIPNKINSDEAMLNILDKSPKNSLNLLHTHTRNVGFSGKDFGTMCEYASVNSINAQCPDGSEYYASIGSKGERPEPDEVIDLANKEARKLLKNPRYANMKPDDVRWTALIRERNEIIRKEYNWDLR